MNEREPDAERNETDESPEEFAEEMESDPSRAPDDEGSGVDELRGG
jgi:hypothetical protein